MGIPTYSMILKGAYFRWTDKSDLVGWDVTNHAFELLTDFLLGGGLFLALNEESFE